MKRLVVLIVFLMGLMAWFIHSTVGEQDTATTPSVELVANDSSHTDSLSVEHKE